MECLCSISSSFLKSYVHGKIYTLSLYKSEIRFYHSLEYTDISGMVLDGLLIPYRGGERGWSHQIHWGMMGLELTTCDHEPIVLTTSKVLLYLRTYIHIPSAVSEFALSLGNLLAQWVEVPIGLGEFCLKRLCLRVRGGYLHFQRFVTCMELHHLPRHKLVVLYSVGK